MKLPKLKTGVAWAAVALIAIGVLIAIGAQAQPALAQTATPQPPNQTNETCLACHTNRSETFAFASGETKSINVDNAALDQSVHGSHNPNGSVACADCHGTAPHFQGKAPSLRAFVINISKRCANCHSSEGSGQADSVHSRAQAAGNLNAATCVDCHGSHTIAKPGQPRAAISETCGQCHQQIFAVYKESVHGAALLEQSNPDVPTCINCHGVHDIQNPTTATFRLNSPQLCASCHADKALMSKYGISTEVFNTYVSDFHGSTTTLFERQAPDQPVNKAVCYDCHGVHDIRAPDDPKSSVMKDNLLATCRKCHPDAAANFPTAWMSHYIPSPDKNSLVYYVDQFYQVFIPGVLGFMLIIVFTDIFRRVSDRIIKPNGKAGKGARP